MLRRSLAPTLVILLAGSTGVAEAPKHRFHTQAGALPADQIARLSAHCEQVQERVRAFIDDTEPSPSIDYHIYPSFEAKGLATGNTALRHADLAAGEIHLVINDWIRGDDALMDARLIVRRHFGMPATHALDVGLAMFFTTEWRKRGWEYWAARLHASGTQLPLVDLLDNDTFADQSYLVTSPLAASFVAFIVNTFGKRVLLDNYKTWRPSGPEEIDRLQKGWHLYLDGVTAGYERRFDRDRGGFPRATGFRKGFCHAHEGYRIYNGYLSDASDQALGRLAGIGTTAVSLTPFSYMRDPHKPVPLPFSHNSGSENDESIIHSSNTAQRLGMAVMLKPHLWLGHSWPGDIEMRSDDDWRRFFDYYERWIQHYALLAEMYEIETLCIGVELARATVGHEDEWRSIIAGLRKLYSGRLVYAANWGEEFENIAFWDALDYIGVNCYYPLGEDDLLDIDALTNAARGMFERIERVSARFERPVIITEIGFTSTDAPWKQPHEPVRRRGRTVNVDHQALCYQAVFEALYGATWCEGIYWWKWPSFLEYGGPHNPDFTPNGKPAERVVAEWYSKSW